MKIVPMDISHCSKQDQLMIPDMMEVESNALQLFLASKVFVSNLNENISLF